MANYTTLKASVNAYIKANGVRAITGPVLNGILTQMINTLGDGARYGGIATPSGNPGTHDNVVFFLATTAGTYTNYGGAVLDGSTLHILYYDSTWHDLDTGVPTSTAFATKADKDEDAVEGNIAMFDSNGNPVDGGVSVDALNQLGQIVTGGYNYKDGYYLDSSGQEVADENYCASDFIALPDSARNNGLIYYYGTYSSNPRIVLYNAQKEVVSAYGMTNGEPLRAFSSSQVGDASFARISFSKNYVGKLTDRQSTPVTLYEAGTVTGLVDRVEELEVKVDTFPGVESVPTIGSSKVVTSNGLALQFIEKIFPQVRVTRKNLFNKEAIKDGYYIKSDGTYASSSSFACSEIIPVAPNTDYYLSNGNNAAVGNVNSFGFFYNIDGTKVLFNTGSKEVHTPVGCCAIEFSYIKAYEDAVQFEKGIQRTTYESFISSDIVELMKNIGEMTADTESILPRQIFLIKGEQNSFYHSEYCKNYDDSVVYADKTGGGFTYNKRCWRVEGQDNISGNLQFSLRYRRTDNALKSFKIPARVGLKTNTANNVKVNIIGDSFCYGGHYIKQVADCCGNADFVGMRKTQYYPSLYCEGRGGWTLATYFSPISSDVTLAHMQPFSPFMHASGYRYYGVIEFWAAIVNGTSQYTYGTNGFDNYSLWFGTDGRKVNPSVNDLMYNTDAGKFEYWDGSNWTQLNTAPDFSFDYAKYIDVWQISSPDFVVVQLGTNDFFSGNANMTEWFSRMDAVIASIKSYATSVGKTINILICTVLTASGTPNNTYNNGIIKRNHYYYDARKAVIEKYDPEENYNTNKVSVVDTGIVVDDEYGFLTNDVLPFEYYEGTARELFDTNGVHPDVSGYKQFGNPIAGAIQYLRS